MLIGLFIGAVFGWVIGMFTAGIIIYNTLDKRYKAAYTGDK
jgi:uncharacterized membrane protein